ncbi:MAG: hypothetical protein IPN18_01145 [Ignavibacteriales bacterium]|nr:hypothetical protein [Ignavibacteriales bacterium]
MVPDSVVNKPIVVPGGSMTQSSGSTVRVFGTSNGSNVTFQFPTGTNKSVWAGTLSGELNGIAAKFYCIDISTISQLIRSQTQMNILTMVQPISIFLTF